MSIHYDEKPLNVLYPRSSEHGLYCLLVALSIFTGSLLLNVRASASVALLVLIQQLVEGSKRLPLDQSGLVCDVLCLKLSLKMF